jgi:hypothetical protein
VFSSPSHPEPWGEQLIVGTIRLSGSREEAKEKKRWRRQRRSQRKEL